MAFIWCLWRMYIFVYLYRLCMYYIYIYIIYIYIHIEYRPVRHFKAFINNWQQK